MATYGLHTASPLGVPTRGFREMTVPSGAFSVGGGSIGAAGATAKGHRESEVPVVHAYATKPWLHSKFHLKQHERQMLFNVRTSGRHPEVVAIATDFQLNAILLSVHERMRRLSYDQRQADDTAQIDELVAQMRESGEMQTLGASAVLTRDEARQRANAYTTAEGICSLWNYLGIYQNDAGREPGQNWFTLNVVHQGPTLVDNVFERVASDGSEPVLDGTIVAGDYLRLVLRRRFDVARDEYAEFSIVHEASQDRYPTVEARQYRGYDGYAEYGPWWRVGRVLAAQGPEPVARDIVTMRGGIYAPWEDAYEAHGRCTSHLKISVGPDRWEMGSC